MNNSIFKFTKEEKINILLKTKIVQTNNEINYKIDEKIIDRFKLLSCALLVDNEKNAWEIMKAASILFHPLNDSYFNQLYCATAFKLILKYDKNEFYYQNMFKKNYSKIRKGKVIHKKSNGLDIPDSWVDKNGEIIPVEVKIEKFNGKALKQLLRYMETYNCKNGIAVAKELTIGLPKEIEFISIKELEEANE